MGFSSFHLQNNLGTTADQESAADSLSPSSSASSSSSDEVFSLDSSDSAEDVTSSATSPSSSASNSSSSGVELPSAPLNDMSSLLHQLPFKRGLSKFYQGKSQSFSHLSNVRSLEDLAKPENPYNKKFKSCRSYGGLIPEVVLKSSNHLPSKTVTNNNGSSSRLVSKKGSRSSCSSLGVRRASSFLGNRPPVPIPPPLRSTSSSSFSNQMPLFA